MAARLPRLRGHFERIRQATANDEQAPSPALCYREKMKPLLASVGSALLLTACRANNGPPDAGGEPFAHPCLRALAVESVQDVGAFPLPSAITVGRDGTESGAFHGRLLWTFGDTFVTQRNPIDNSNVLSATAGWSDPSSPLALDQPVDDGGFPAQLVPYTADELLANRGDALNGWALWPAAAIDTGAAEALLFFQRVKRTNGSGFQSIGVGTARLALGATHAVRNPDDLFSLDGGTGDAGVPLLYGASTPTLLGDRVFFPACGPTGFFNFGCRVSRAPVAQADNRAAYEFFDGSTWTKEIARAAVVINEAPGLSITFNPYLGCYLAVSGGIVSSTMTLRVSDRLEADWGSAQDGVTLTAAADGGILSPASGSYDYLFHEHVELRSADGRQIYVTYARPTAPFRGDVRLVRITLR
jgi:hypothetical protein